MGTNTDPYQWVESRYKLMPGIWEAMRDARNPCSILTKSPLLLRDLELMKEIAAVTDIHANLSIPTLDAKAWRATEPHTPHPRARLEAVAELNRNGIPCGMLIAPLMPGINDAPEQVEPLLEAAAEAGATGHRRDRAAPARRRQGSSSSTGCATSGRTSSRSTRGSTRGAPTRRRASASGWRSSCGATRRRGRAVFANGAGSRGASERERAPRRAAGGAGVAVLSSGRHRTDECAARGGLRGMFNTRSTHTTSSVSTPPASREAAPAPKPRSRVATTPTCSPRPPCERSAARFQSRLGFAATW